MVAPPLMLQSGGFCGNSSRCRLGRRGARATPGGNRIDSCGQVRFLWLLRLIFGRGVHLAGSAVKPTGHARLARPVKGGSSFKNTCRKVLGYVLGLLCKAFEVSGQLDGLCW